MTPLPRPSIDTGLGLERLAAVVQGFNSNWESDLFAPIIHHVEDLSGKKCTGQDLDSIAIRVIADHSRAAAFLIADGVLPSNDGRGYVLRRILRRALRYGKYIGLNEPFLFDSAGVVISTMSEAYSELSQHEILIKKVIKNEEERFLETLARGLILFEEEAARLSSLGSRTLPGEVVFKLYDTFGFPPDLTADMAKESGFEIDQPGFDREMARQREQARQAWDGSQGRDLVEFRSILESGARTEFSGYETVEDSGKIVGLLRDGKPVGTVSAGEQIEIITDKTPFYAESGGQVGDLGTISSNGNLIQVTDTQKPLPEIVVHVGVVQSGARYRPDEG